MQATNKYHAVKVKIDETTFDSKFEAKVYEILRYRFGKDNITVHCSTPIFRSTTLYPKGKNWKIDFQVVTNNNVIYVEAKGKINLELYWQLTSLEAMRPEIFNRLILVFDRANGFEKTLLGSLRNNIIPLDNLRFPQVTTYSELLSKLTRIKSWE